MIRVAIVEDNQSDAQVLKEYVEKFSKENDTAFNVTCFPDGEDIVEDYTPIYDIIFIDIEMRWMDGMTTAQEIRRRDQEVIIIFVTNMAQYAIKGYTVDALHYLLKPLPYFAFSEQMKRSIEKLLQRRSSSVVLPLSSGAERLNCSDIIYVESDRHVMTFYTEAGTKSYRGTMRNLEEKLVDKGFFRCNNCYLVNLLHVKSVIGNTVFVGGFELAISRNRKKPFLEALTKFVGTRL